MANPWNYIFFSSKWSYSVLLRHSKEKNSCFFSSKSCYLRVAKILMKQCWPFKWIHSLWGLIFAPKNKINNLYLLQITFVGFLLIKIVQSNLVKKIYYGMTKLQQICWNYYRKWNWAQDLAVSSQINIRRKLMIIDILFRIWKPFHLVRNHLKIFYWWVSSSNDWHGAS